jgi:hypothetical protein
MNISQLSNKIESKYIDKDEHLSTIDKDLSMLFLLAQGRVRFGNGGNAIGDNIAGQFLTFTTSATPDAENTLVHKLDAIPVGYIIVKQNKAGSLYTGTTSWTKSNLYLKCSVASVTYTVFLLK